ncbi:hypothetical protein GCM10020229_37400 [Kitasatospora albolonga]|uniref:hypothetical protein n=1 Tax=Kitasatospora albolonga TaxID=68173 RepID=UPI0031EF2419
MTSSRDPLTALHRHLVEQIDASLDLESGLQELSVSARHAALVEELDRVIDVESGLSPLLRPTSGRAPHRPDLTVGRQLGLRQDPLVRVAVLTEEATRLLRVLQSVHRTLALAETLSPTAPTLRLRSHLGRAARTAAELGVTGGSELAAAQHRVRAEGFDTRARRLVLDVVRSLDSEVHQVRFGLNLLTRGSRADWSALSVALAAYLAAATGHSAAPLDHALAVATRQRETLDDSLADLLDVPRGPGLCAELHAGLLDDVTRADLTDVPLTGPELVGLRWSLEGTRWPSSVNVHLLLAQSVEHPSGVYTVLPPGATDDDRVRT